MPIEGIIERNLGSLYATWLTVGVALMGQALWFSWQYGTLGQRVTDLDRRQAVSEAVNGQFNSIRNQIDVNTRRLDAVERYVPDRLLALATSDAAQQQTLAAVERRVGAIETGGSPALVGVRNQVEIDQRRLSEVERYVPDRLLQLSTSEAAAKEAMMAITRQLAAYDLWRAAQDKAAVDINSRVSNLDARVSATEVVANNAQRRPQQQ